MQKIQTIEITKLMAGYIGQVYTNGTLTAEHPYLFTDARSAMVITKLWLAAGMQDVLE
jgi:hypothetical protein